MWNNKNFLMLSAAFALIYGMMMAMSVTFSNLFNPFGYSPAEISIVGGSSIIVGMVGAMTVGWILDRTARYRMTLITLSSMGVIAMSTALITLVFSDKNIGYLFCPIVAVGLVTTSYFPACISYGAELTFPMQPAMANASMNFLG